MCPEYPCSVDSSKLSVQRRNRIQNHQLIVVNFGHHHLLHHPERALTTFSWRRFPEFPHFYFSLDAHSAPIEYYRTHSRRVEVRAVKKISFYEPNKNRGVETVSDLLRKSHQARRGSLQYLTWALFVEGFHPKYSEKFA